MDKKLKLKVGAGVAAAAAVAGGGAAIAADRFGSSSDSQAVVNDAAKQLGVTPSALSSALKKALENRVDAAVAAGELTKAQGDELKQRIESGALPLFFGPRGGPHEHFGELDAAASYLGLTEAQLETQLESGKSLAQVAKDRGKSVDGLIQALVDQATKRLDAAVAAGRLTKAQEQQILSGLKQRITDFVNGVRDRDRDHEFRFDRGFAGPPGPPPDSAAA
jgi:CRISPR/Cas system-associated endoribonuclease Cas2